MTMAQALRATLARRAYAAGWWPASLHLRRDHFLTTPLGRAPVVEFALIRRTPGNPGMSVVQFSTRGRWRYGRAREALWKALVLACPGIHPPRYGGPTVVGASRLEEPDLLARAPRRGVVRVSASVPIPSGPFQWMSPRSHLRMALAGLAVAGRTWKLEYASLRRFETRRFGGKAHVITREVLLSTIAGDRFACMIDPRADSGNVDGEWLDVLAASIRRRLPRASVRMLQHRHSNYFDISKGIVPGRFGRDLAALANWRIPSPGRKIPSK